MLKALIDTFNFCSINQIKEKQEFKLEISKNEKERSQSPMLISMGNDLKFSKVSDIKKSNQKLLSINPLNDFMNNSPNLSSKKTINSEFEENNLLFSKKSFFTNEEIEKNYKLILSDFEGDLLYGKIIKINSAGIKNSLRKQKDGISFFGIKTNNENKNDFILNLQKIFLNHKKKIIENIFAIYFDKNDNKYYLQSFLKECGENIYFKINETGHRIKNKDKFLIGDIIFSVGIENNNNDLRIILNNLENENNTLNYIFKKPSKGKNILIGRSRKCNVYITSSLLSKFHCNIIFDYDKNCYLLYDGYNGKFSTNGTWYVIKDKIDIVNNKVDDYFKIGKKILKIEKKK